MDAKEAVAKIRVAVYALPPEVDKAGIVLELASEVGKQLMLGNESMSVVELQQFCDKVGLDVNLWDC
jgi:hypothetical protein